MSTSSELVRHRGLRRGHRRRDPGPRAGLSRPHRGRARRAPHGTRRRRRAARGRRHHHRHDGRARRERREDRRGSRRLRHRRSRRLDRGPRRRGHPPRRLSRRLRAVPHGCRGHDHGRPRQGRLDRGLPSRRAEARAEAAERRALRPRPRPARPPRRRPIAADARTSGVVPRCRPGDERRSGPASSPASVQPPEAMIRFVARAGRPASCRICARKLPGRGVWVTRPREVGRRGGQAQALRRAPSRPTAQAAPTCPTEIDAAAAGRPAAGAVAGQQGRRASIAGFAKVEAAIGGQARRRRGDPCRGGSRGRPTQDRAASCDRRHRRGHIRHSGHRRSVERRIGLGIGSGTCDTCCARRGRRKRRLPLALASATAPSRCARRSRPIARSASTAPLTTHGRMAGARAGSRDDGNPQDPSGMSDTKNPGDKTLHVVPRRRCR